MSFLDTIQRFFKIGVAEANAKLDKMEDPVKMSEQAILDLKKDLNTSLQALAEVKALSIRSKRELEQTQKESVDYENKAILLIKKAQAGEIAESEADRLASQALAKKDQLDQRIEGAKKNVQHYDQMVAKMDINVQKLKEQIMAWETEVRTLKARSKVSEATARLNKQLSRTDSNDTLSLLEKMRDKVSSQEALAESYGEMSSPVSSLDEEINRALGVSNASPNKSIGEGSDALARLKAKIADTPASIPPVADTKPPEEVPQQQIEENAELQKLKDRLKTDNSPSE